MVSKEDRVLLVGLLSGVSDDPIPAAWEARIENRMIAEWRVFANVSSVD
jgi:hypothetical protein